MDEKKHRGVAVASCNERKGNVAFVRRLGGYKYYDMDKAIAAAFDVAQGGARGINERTSATEL